jgi:hypothetical protein
MAMFMYPPGLLCKSKTSFFIPDLLIWKAIDGIRRRCGSKTVYLYIAHFIVNHVETSTEYWGSYPG